MKMADQQSAGNGMKVQRDIQGELEAVWGVGGVSLTMGKFRLISRQRYYQDSTWHVTLVHVFNP